MLKKGDFHMHSTCSDGNLSPVELVRYAKKRKVDIIALTDHNNVDGLDEAINEGKNIGVIVIPAVELSTKYKNNRVHILGYFKDDSYKNELLVEILYNIKNKRGKQVEKIFRNSIDFNNYNNKIYVEAGISILKFFGAEVVLAHPVLLSNECFKNVSRMSFDGIEAKYFKNTDKDTDYFVNFAKDNNIFYTAGSDFHTRIEEYRVHGLIGDSFLDENEIEVFLNKSGLNLWVKNFYKNNQ